MSPLTETRKHTPVRVRRREPTARGEGDIDIVAVGTVALVILTALLVVLTALTVHNNLVTAGVGIVAIVGGGYALVAGVRHARDRDRRSQKATANLARRIEHGKRGVAALLPWGKDSTQSLDDLEKFLKEGERLSVVRLDGSGTLQAKQLLDDLEEFIEENERLSVVRLDSRHILEAPPGIPEGAIPDSLVCLKIVGLIGWELEDAPGLSEKEKEVAEELREVVPWCLQQSDPLAKLREYAVSLVQAREGLTDRLVLLANARPEALERPAGKWLLDLFDGLGCHFGVLTQEGQPPGKVGPIITWPDGQRYVSDTLSPWLSEQEVDGFFPSLRVVVGVRPGLDLGLLKIRCAVLAVADELGKQAEAIERLPAAGSPVPKDLVKAAMLEVGWLVDCKAARIGVLDRLAVIREVTPEMFAVLLRDLDLDAEGARELYDWLRGDELRLAGIIVSTEDAISLGDTVRGATLKWLGEDEQSAAYQKARIAAERCYRECLILDPAHVPGSGYDDWTKQGYSGLALFENIDWRLNVRAWCSLAADIDSPEDRSDARVAITCLFLEAWWWWGDQLRLPFAGEVLDLAREILRDQPGWINALDEFNDNYEPEFGQRAEAEDKWRHVAHALGFLADSLELRRGNVPPDHIRARIYICWCFFNGDAAQHTGDLEAADGWFRLAAEACGEDEDGAAMRTFASYQRADVWIPSDTDRSLRLITDTGLADAAVDLDDQSLRAYIARMYGDIRWKSGNVDGAFDAYGRALMLAYVYQVDQESEKMPPSEYTYRLYSEIRARFLARRDDAREEGLESAADAAIERITKLFGPYWALKRPATTSDEDPLAGIVPPLPDPADLDLGSGYVRDASLMLKDKLREQVAEPVDQPLPKLKKEPGREGTEGN